MSGRLEYHSPSPCIVYHHCTFAEEKERPPSPASLRKPENASLRAPAPFAPPAICKPASLWTPTYRPVVQLTVEKGRVEWQGRPLLLQTVYELELEHLVLLHVTAEPATWILQVQPAPDKSPLPPSFQYVTQTLALSTWMQPFLTHILLPPPARPTIHVFVDHGAMAQTFLYWYCRLSKKLTKTKSSSASWIDVSKHWLLPPCMAQTTIRGPKVDNVSTPLSRWNSLAFHELDHVEGAPVDEWTWLQQRLTEKGEDDDDFVVITISAPQWDQWKDRGLQNVWTRERVHTLGPLDAQERHGWKSFAQRLYWSRNNPQEYTPMLQVISWSQSTWFKWTPNKREALTSAPQSGASWVWIRKGTLDEPGSLLGWGQIQTVNGDAIHLLLPFRQPLPTPVVFQVTNAGLK